MRGLKNKSIIITGGLGDLGFASAIRLVEEGCHVNLWDLADPEIGSTSASGIGATYSRVDVSSVEQVQAALRSLLDEKKRVDVLINAATKFIFKGVSATRNDWENILSVNLIGTSTVTSEVVSAMKISGSGVIINFSSVSGFIGQSEFATYNATKFALRGLTKCWAKDLAQFNIRVNTICPGYIYTKAFENSCRDLGLDPVVEDQRAAAMHLLNRQGQPAEVAAAVAFLASEDSSFMTGTDLIVDGGYLAQ